VAPMFFQAALTFWLSPACGVQDCSMRASSCVLRSSTVPVVHGWPKMSSRAARDAWFQVVYMFLQWIVFTGRIVLQSSLGVWCRVRQRFLLRILA